MPRSSNTDLVAAVLEGDQRAMGRAISMAERNAPGSEDLFAALYPHTGRAAVIGLTGPPGAGKSTLVDRLAANFRGEGKSVGILAVDPSSPLTGGAVLGDRIRMQERSYDPGVFIRSFGARGQLGGLAAPIYKAVHVLDAAGKDIVLIETVGVGQSELEIARMADTTIVVLTPAAGDGVQVIKAGITEVADIFVVNKADFEGSKRLVRDLRATIGHAQTGAWQTPVIEAQAIDGTGVDKIAEATSEHRRYQEEAGALPLRRRARLESEIVAIAYDAVRVQTLARLQASDDLLTRVEQRVLTPFAAAHIILTGANAP